MVYSYCKNKVTVVACKKGTLWFTLTAKTRSLWWHAKKGHYGVLVLQKQGRSGGMQNRDTMVNSYCKHKDTVVACKIGTLYGLLLLQKQGHCGGMQKRDTMMYSYCKNKDIVVACKKGTL
jgi:hypothetical protein